MSSRCRDSLSIPQPLRRLGPALALALGLCVGGRAEAAGSMSFCIDQGNPLHRMDEAVAKAVAHEAGATARFTRFDTTSKTDAMRAEKPGFFVHLAGRCDFVMGFPVEAGYPTIPEGLQASRPYAVTGFVLAERGGTARPFSALPPHASVGTSYLSVPTTWFEDRPELDEHVYETPAALFAALEAKQIDAALIWQPWLVHELAAHPAAVSMRRLAQPHASWNIVALSRAGGGEAARFDAGLVRLDKSGRLGALVAPYAVPVMKSGPS